MIYLKSVVAGFVGAFLAVVLCAAGIWAWLLFTVWREDSSAGGGIGAVSIGAPFNLVVLAGFMLGFWWEFRRARRRAGL